MAFGRGSGTDGLRVPVRLDRDTSGESSDDIYNRLFRPFIYRRVIDFFTPPPVQACLYNEVLNLLVWVDVHRFCGMGIVWIFISVKPGSFSAKRYFESPQFHHNRCSFLYWIETCNP